MQVMGNIYERFLENQTLEVGKGKIIKEGNQVAVLNLGTRLEACIDAMKILEQYSIYATLADARFAKPLDTKLIDFLLDNHKFILTIEEGSIGGFSSSILHYIHNIKTTENNSIIKTPLDNYY